MTKSNVKKGPATRDSAFNAPPSPLPRRILNAKPGSASASRTVRDKLERILDELDSDAMVRVLDAAMAARHAMSLTTSRKAEKPETHPTSGQDAATMRIERADDGDTYHLIAGKVWKMLAAEEIAALLRIARHVESETAASRHLFLWLDRERKDIAADLEITAASSKSLPAILRLLKETFPVKSPRRLP